MDLPVASVVLITIASIVLFIVILIGLVMSGACGRLGFWRFVANYPLYPLLLGLGPITLTQSQRNAFKFTDIPSLVGKVSIVTGSNTGLGYWTAYHLAGKGSTVVIACRSVKKGDEAAATIRTDFPHANIVVLELDMSSLESVHSFQKIFKSKFDRLDIAVFNAGFNYLENTFRLSKDGFEELFAVNHLAHFKLYKDLEDLLIHTATTHNTVATVTVVSSTASFEAKSLPKSLEELNNQTGFNAMKQFAKTKLFNILLSNEIADRMKTKNINNVLANSLGPGGANTNAPANFEKELRRGPCGFCIGSIFHRFREDFLWSPEAGCLNQLYCATSPKITEGRISGKYFHPIGIEVPCNRLASKKLQTEAWDLSETLLKSKGY